jgi:hypothetical protein
MRVQEQLQPENVVVQRRAVSIGCVETAKQVTTRHVDDQVAGFFAAPEYLAAHDVVEIVGVGDKFALKEQLPRE